jgi:Bacterial Ig-like domain (group 3)
MALSIRRSSRSLLAFAAIAVAASALAAVPTFWRLESQADFLAGDVEGVSISSEGTISLAPAAQVLAEANDPYFWSLAVDGARIYLGSGNDGKVYRVEATGESRVLADTNELQVHALAVDRRGVVYAGTSPRGSVYKIGTDGRMDVFFDPEDRYIWSLAMDSKGNLLVATGDRARIYRVDPAGQSEVLFESQETHIVSLAIDGDDNVYAGTDANGLVLRVDPNGATTVLFDTPFQEVRSVVLDSRRNVYAATVNGGVRASQPPEAMPAPSGPAPAITAVPSSGEMVTVTATTNVVATPASGPPPPVAAGAAGGLYRITPDGAAELMWQSRTDPPLSLALATDDRLLIGSGTEGRVFLVSQDQTNALFLSAEADQVTAVGSGGSGETYLATSNPAKLYRLNRGRRTEGNFRSPAIDTKTVSSWGKIRWQATTPSGTTIKLQTRSGNSAEPDNTWSDWSQPYTSALGEQISSPRSRFLQWRAILNSTGEVSPELFDVTAIYLQQNLAPEVGEIVIHPPGQTFQKPIVATGQLEILGMEEVLSETSPRNGGPAPPSGAGPAMSLTAIARPFFRKGIQTVTWKASDPNEDELRFTVHYRAEGETLWKVLRQDLTQPVIAWDTAAMPDGRYTVKIVARDAASNPAESAREGERTSQSFEVDNTPPRVTGLRAEAGQSGHRVVFTAQDDISSIQTVEYAVNSGKWTLVFPTDGIADSKEETFDFTLPGYRDGGIYTLVVKVTDVLGNTVTARADLGR